MSHRKKHSAKSPRKSAAARIEAASVVAASPAVDLQSLKVAIVCDWLTGTGGAERVVLEMHKLFPNAPIYTSQYDRNPAIWYGDKWFQDADVRTTWLQKLPGKLKKFLPVLRAQAFARLDLSEYDLVIAASGAEAKAVKTGPNTKLVWYCHAPTHYYWSRYDDYMKHPGFGALNPLARLGLFTLVGPLRKWDYAAAQHPDFILANSSHTANEIKKYYGRESTVVFPPVDIERFGRHAVAEPDDKSSTSNKSRADRFGFVIAGRQTPYKKIDLAVEACSSLNLPLTVIGSGPDHDKLTAMAGQSVRFLNKVSDAEMAHHFKLANAFIFPGVDDFGIVAVEALSAGTPVIAYKAGGALDYVDEGVTGSFFAEQTPESLMEALRKFQPSHYDSDRIVAEAQQYSASQFAVNVTRTIQRFLRQTEEQS
jgi:glycosyltransferase involved in cell wall biosynthesis